MLLAAVEIPIQAWAETFQKCVADPATKAMMEK